MTNELETRLPITPGARWSFGSGGIVWGVIWNAHYFVLIFYSQVLGLDPGLAGLAIGTGLCSCYAINRYRITRVGHSEALVRLADG